MHIGEMSFLLEMWLWEFETISLTIDILLSIVSGSRIVTFYSEEHRGDVPEVLLKWYLKWWWSLEKQF